MAARAGLNMGIAAYCLRLVLRKPTPGAAVAVAAMVAATLADSPAIKALRGSAGR